MREVIVSFSLALAACAGGGARSKAAVAPRPSTDAAAAGPAPAGAPPITWYGDVAEQVCGSENAEANRHYDRGVRLYDEGDAGAAAREYMQAIELDPRYCDAMDNLAVILRRNGMIPEAITLYERSLAVAPANQFAWQNLGVAYRLGGRHDDALRAYQRLTELSPDNPEGWYGVAQVSLIVDRPDEALSAARRAEALYVAAGSELVGDARLPLGTAALRLRDWPTARAAFDGLDDRIAGDVEINLGLGEAYLQPGAVDRPRARGYLERARELGGTVPPELWRRAQ